MTKKASSELAADLNNLGSIFCDWPLCKCCALLQRTLDIPTKSLGLNDPATVQAIAAFAICVGYIGSERPRRGEALVIRKTL